jgi:hypothetical protein
MSSRRVLGTLVVLTLSLLGLAAVPGAPAAQAVTGSPPVTTPDSVTVFQGNITSIQPVNNDHDPDNDQLALCRLGTEPHRGILIENVGNDLAILAKPRATPGIYTITYYACDFSYLTAGTVTITVEELPKISVKKIPNNPGHLRVTNPADFKIRFLYGSEDEPRPDGNVIIDSGSTVVIPVHRTQIIWVAINRKGDLFLGSGRVNGIKLDRAGAPTAGRVTLSPRQLEAWRSV